MAEINYKDAIPTLKDEIDLEHLAPVFEAIGRVILACQQAGIQKVGFITEPHALDANSY